MIDFKTRIEGANLNCLVIDQVTNYFNSVMESSNESKQHHLNYVLDELLLEINYLKDKVK